MPQLKRELGLFNVTVAGVGIILGAGIYALIGLAASYSGNATWLAFLFSALIALFTGLSYAELSSMFKGDAGEYDYIKASFNKPLAMFISFAIIFAGVFSAATVALGFAGYLTQLINISLFSGALLLIGLMTLINFAGIKQASWFNTISTFIEFFGLIVIILIGVKYFGNVNYFTMPYGLTGIFKSTALVFFAYMGFESVIKLREETKNPERVIPLGLMYSIGITAVVYVLVAISAVSIIGWDALSNSTAPLADVAAAVLGSPAFMALGIIALFSTANTVLITMVTTSRLIYGMARKKALPSTFATVHKRTHTPSTAVIVVAIVTAFLAYIGDLELVANITNLLLFLTFAVVNASLLILRYKLPKLKRPFRAPLNIGQFSVFALIGLLSSVFMFGFVLFNFL